MSQIHINTSFPNDNLGDPLRTAFNATESNFDDLYANKVDKVAGKDLSSNDYDDLSALKLSGIEEGAEKNVQADFLQSDETADDYIKNKPDSLYNAVGWFDYSDVATQTTPLALVANVAKKMTNDGAGVYSSSIFSPYGVLNIWNVLTNQLNFSELSIGDTVDIRTDFVTTTTAANQILKGFIRFGIGSPSQFDFYFSNEQRKTASEWQGSFHTGFYIGSEDIQNYPAEIYLISDNGATVKVNGWYIRIIRQSANIISTNSGTEYNQNYTYISGGQTIAVPATLKVSSMFLNDGRLLKNTIDWVRTSPVLITILYTLESADTIYITGLT